MDTAQKLYPNSTQIPNVILWEWMPHLNDTEFRVVMVIADQTYGWHKNTDRISYSQLVERTGRFRAAITKAIQNLRLKGYIRVLDSDGNIIKTKEASRGKVLFYQIAKPTSSESELVEQKKFGKRTSFNKEKEKESNKEKEKESIFNNILLRNSNFDEIAGNKLNELINLFKPINPSYEKLYSNNTQRRALENLVKKHGLDKTRRMLEQLPQIVSRPYAPVITTPCQLESKLGELVLFMRKEQQPKKGGTLVVT